MTDQERALLGEMAAAVREALRRHQWEDHYGHGCDTCESLEALLSSEAAQAALREREELLEDRRRLDWLLAIHFTDRARVDEGMGLQKPA